MGLELLGTNELDDWVKIIHDHCTKATEIVRRAATRERVCLYRDDYRTYLEKMVRQVFSEPEIVERVLALVPLVGGTSFIKRVADDLARPLYARAPLRRLSKKDKAGEAALSMVATTLEINSRLDDVARLLVAANDVFLFPRKIEGLGLRIDILTGADLWIIGHPEAPSVPIAYVYEFGDKVKLRRVIDDRRTFAIDSEGHLVETPREHGMGIIPIVDVHRKGLTHCPFDSTSGNDLVNQTRNSMFYDLVVLRKIKSQSHLQLVFSGDSDGFVKDQVSDEESVLISHGQGTISTLNLESDPTKIIEAKRANESIVASNYGLTDDEDDTRLRERVSELAAIMVRAEQRLWDVLRVVSPDLESIPGDAKILVDLGTIHHRIDRKTQLEIRQLERSMGLRSGVDDILEDNPEIADRDEALKWIDEKMTEEAVIIAKRRALNMPEDATTENPGQSAQENGALGPAVRDGKVSRDNAAKQASEGPAPKVTA